VNSVYAAGWGILSELASHFDSDLAQKCKNAQIRTEKAILSKCWAPDLSQFVSLYKERRIEVESVQTLFPLLLESVSDSMLKSMIYRQLTNTSRFWTTYPVPSVSQAAPQFEPVFSIDLMWRGPTWAFPNWFIMEGLIRHGYRAEAEDLLSRWVALYEKTGIYEQYNPLTGAGYGPEGLGNNVSPCEINNSGMSTLIVDWLYRLGWAS
jgi:glycogen debranching enzyme